MKKRVEKTVNRKSKKVYKKLKKEEKVLG